MGIKLLLDSLGLGQVVRKQEDQLSPLARDRKRLTEDFRLQLIELQKKGLSIPIFTL